MEKNVIAQVDKAMDDHKRKPLMMQQQKLESEIEDLKKQFETLEDKEKKEMARLKILIRVNLLELSFFNN